MLQLILLLLVGFFVLIKGADWLVDGGVLVARKLRVSPLIIGLTIVAFGTSAPELVVNIISALSYEGSGIGLGNIIGSNIANIGLIIGVAAIIFPLTIKASTIAREIPLMIMSGVLFLALLADRFLNQAEANMLSRTDGVVLLIFFVGFIYYLLHTALSQRRNKSAAFEQEFDHEPKSASLLKGVVLLTVGLIGILIGGQLVVENAADIARALGISEILIGLSIVAVGTSLPELTTAVVASLKKHSDIAIGGIVGSNVFNTLFILGVNAVISPVPFQTAWFVDLAVMITVSILLYAAGSRSDRKITRREGLLLLSIYVAYITFTIIRG